MRHVLKTSIRYIITLIVTIFVLYPVGWMITFSLRSKESIFTIPPRFIPEEFVFENYINVWKQGVIPRFFINSLIVSIITTIIVVAISSIGAYSLSRFEFKGKRLFSLSVLSSQLFPAAVLLVPLLLFFNAINLYDNQLALIISYSGLCLPFSFFLLVGIYNTIPRDIEEAAYIDGASKIQTFIRIVLPNASIGLAIVALFTFVSSWQEVLLALSFILTENKRTLPVGLMYFFGQHQTDYAGLMAASCIASFPSIILFIFLQRYLVRGLIGGALKE